MLEIVITENFVSRKLREHSDRWILKKSISNHIRITENQSKDKEQILKEFQGVRNTLPIEGKK